VNEEIPEPNAIPAEECFAQNEVVIEYVNAASHGATSFPATDLLKYVFKTLLCWNLCVFPVAEGASTEMCFTGGEIAATGANNNLLWLFLVIFLVFAILAFFWLRRRCRQLENDLYAV
jgi:LPXTG-motif cell wall-anchored protein